MSAADAIRNAEADSQNRAMPATNPPTAPTPVHTAYAVPIGIDHLRCERRLSECEPFGLADEPRVNEEFNPAEIDAKRRVAYLSDFHF